MNKNRLLLGHIHLLEVHNSFHFNSYFLFFFFFFFVVLELKIHRCQVFHTFKWPFVLDTFLDQSTLALFFSFSTSWELLLIFLNPPLCLDTRGVFQIEVLISIAWGCSSSGPVREINFLFQVSLTYLLHIQSQVALAYLCISFSGSLWPTFCISNPRSLWPNYAFPFPGRFGLLIACISFSRFLWPTSYTFWLTFFLHF